MPPLAIVPPKPGRRSSLLSSSSSSPRTPRSCGSPCSSLYFTSSNRLSSDSWSSSIHEFEDLESDWKPDQILFLQRTLNALPAHLTTPYNGAIPPSNLLDKIARGVAEKKGADWPHSLRATRVKLIEICRARDVTDENDNPIDLASPRKSNRRPYRQSSMEFTNAPAMKDNPTISRLSARLQRTDRVIPDPFSNPYSRSRTQTQTQPRRSSSPASDVPPLINHSTPSSSTLSSLSSGHRYFLRRSSSTLATSESLMSTESTSGFGLLPSSMPIAPDPRVQRVRRSESFCGTSSTTLSKDASVSSTATPQAPRQGFKRAPSFGTLAQEAKSRGDNYTYGSSVEDLNFGLEPSSDEEEKARTRQAKKPRTQTSTPSQSSKPKASTPTKTTTTRKSEKKSSSTSKDPTSSSRKVADEPPRRMPRRLPLSRHARLFEPELPHLHIPSSDSHEPMLETPLASPTLPSRPLPNPPAVARPAIKSLRRVRRLPPSRRISFGSLVPPSAGVDVADSDLVEECELGSAFQLQ